MCVCVCNPFNDIPSCHKNDFVISKQTCFGFESYYVFSNFSLLVAVRALSQKRKFVSVLRERENNNKHGRSSLHRMNNNKTVKNL